VERRRRILALDDGAAVGGHGEADMRGARGDTAVEQAPEREHLRPPIRAEAEIVDEQQEGAGLARKLRNQRGEAGERAGGELQQRERPGLVRLHSGDSGAYQRRFAHPARAPQQRIMRRRP
jgi:hypothetical protein